MSCEDILLESNISKVLSKVICSHWSEQFRRTNVDLLTPHITGIFKDK